MGVEASAAAQGMDAGLYQEFCAVLCLVLDMSAHVAAKRGASRDREVVWLCSFVGRWEDEWRSE